MKLFGPVQLYVVPVEVAVNDKVCPVQIGLGLAEATGGSGVWVIVTLPVP